MYQWSPQSSYHARRDHVRSAGRRGSSNAYFTHQFTSSFDRLLNNRDRSRTCGEKVYLLTRERRCGAKNPKGHRGHWADNSNPN